MEMPRLSPLLVAIATACVLGATDWPQFRGANARGISDTTNLPVQFGPSKNVIWKTSLPPGHSSPVLSADRIFVTAFEAEKLYVIAMDRANGKILWRREVPRPRKQELHKSNSPASPSIATDGRNTFAFFTDFGLISHGPDGEERWRLPLGPFNNPFGLGASPILASGKVIQICDSETGSFLIAADQKTGKVVWRVERPDMTRGFSTPVVYQPKTGGVQILAAGTNRFIAYDVETGKELWSIRGLTWQMKPTPVVDGDVAYILGWAGGADQGSQENIPDLVSILKDHDTNKDGRLAATEVPPRYRKDLAESDFDHDGFYDEDEWKKFVEKRSSINSVMAVHLGGSGDMTAKSVLWRYYKSLPNATSPVLYRNILYLVKEGGIVTALDAAAGTVLKQGRITGVQDFFYSSPVAADGKIYVASQTGLVAVIKAGTEWEILAVNDMDDEVFATPAPVDRRLYVRTRSALYCFGAGSIVVATTAAR
jgi:outer membrane protein assembly factor BamB